ncbi:MAG: DUF4065 domain-containing protein [Flavobacteriales bacterium]|nr:DUF4065 domain-containing protein [Flavobacteriales bacterium]
MRSAAEIANYFISKGVDEGKPLSHLKLQKLLYVAYGWYYAQYNERLFNEVLQAWKYGPVVASVYHALKHHGDMPIEHEIQEEDEDRPGYYHTPTLNYHRDATLIRFLDDIWVGYSHFSAIQLTNYSHLPGTPWNKLVKSLGGQIPMYMDLGDEEVRSYFSAEKERIGNFNPGKVTASE